MICIEDKEKLYVYIRHTHKCVCGGVCMSVFGLHAHIVVL